MADRQGNDVSIDRVTGLSIVSLKVARGSLEDARGRLRLAAPLCVAGSDQRSLWLGPDRWLLVSDSLASDAIISSCNQALSGILHNAVDYSAGLAVLRISGRSARQLLATGTGIDLRPVRFPTGSCCRTRLAHIAAVVAAELTDQFDLYVDRSHATYLTDWLAESASVCSSYGIQAGN